MLGSGQSSLAIWTTFDSMCTAAVRALRARLLVAWTKQKIIDAFAVVGSSIVGGADIVQGSGDNVINDADLYEYFDETERVIRLEYERHLIEPLGGAAIGMATVVLDNTDLRFTPNYNATIGTALKPNRPLKMFIGFEIGGQEYTIPIIEALSLQPKEDKINRTVTVEARDYVTFLDEVPQEVAIYQDKHTDYIIGDILARAGIGSSNYVLDTGLNTVAFAGFGVGDFAGVSIRRLCEAEQGIFFQDEQGRFRFENRNKNAQAPFTQVQWTIEPDDILEWQGEESAQMINYMLISGKPRSLKDEVEIWRDGVEEGVAPGNSLTITAQFDDPVSSISAPEAHLDYVAYDRPDGAGTDITDQVTVTVTAYTNTAEIVLTNNHGTKPAHFYYLKLRGTPATVDYEISEVFSDAGSIATYNEQKESIENDFIQSKEFAQSLAESIVNRYKDPLGVLEIKIRGIPQLQLRDQIRVKDMDMGTYKNYRLVGIQGVFEPGSFTQTLTLRQITANELL